MKELECKGTAKQSEHNNERNGEVKEMARTKGRASNTINERSGRHGTTGRTVKAMIRKTPSSDIRMTPCTTLCVQACTISDNMGWQHTQFSIRGKPLTEALALQLGIGFPNHSASRCSQVPGKPGARVRRRPLLKGFGPDWPLLYPMNNRFPV